MTNVATCLYSEDSWGWGGRACGDVLNLKPVGPIEEIVST